MCLPGSVGRDGGVTTWMMGWWHGGDEFTGLEKTSSSIFWSSRREIYLYLPKFEIFSPAVLDLLVSRLKIVAIQLSHESLS